MSEVAHDEALALLRSVAADSAFVRAFEALELAEIASVITVLEFAPSTFDVLAAMG